MENYIIIRDVQSETEPKVEMPFGKYGIDYNTNIHKIGNMYVFDTMRFNNEADYIRYRKING